jgi:hypothetical protein
MLPIMIGVSDQKSAMLKLSRSVVFNTLQRDEKMSMKKWHEVYQGADERNFFIGKDGNSGMVRSKYEFRSVKALAKESGLDQKRTEEIINKYLKMGILVPSPKMADQYGYWLGVAPHLGVDTNQTVAQADQAIRVKKASKTP